MKRLPRGLWAAIILCVACSGCWDRVELEDIAWVQAMGFDKGPEGYLSTTMEIGVPQSLRGGGFGGGAGGWPHYVTITVLSKTGLEALDLAATSLGRRISLVHSQVFVFGEELARSDLRSLAGAMDRFREIRGTVLIAVAQGRAEDVLRVTTSPLEVSPSRFIQTVMQQHRQTGLFESAAFVRDFVNRVESNCTSPRCPLIGLASDYKPSKEGGQGGKATTPGAQFPSTPEVGQRVPPGRLTPESAGPGTDTTQLTPAELPKLGGGPVVLLGSAFFSGGRMVGTLTGDETRAVLLVRHDFERGSFAIPDPQRPDRPELSLGVGITGSSSRVKVRRQGENVKIDVRVKVEVSYLSPKTETDYTDPRMTPVAEQAIEDHLNRMIGQVISKTKAAGSDPIGFGAHVKGTFWTWPEFDQFAWMTKYPAAEITTSVDAHVKRYGLDLGPLVVPPSERLQKGPR